MGGWVGERGSGWLVGWTDEWVGGEGELGEWVCGWLGGLVGTGVGGRMVGGVGATTFSRAHVSYHRTCMYSLGKLPLVGFPPLEGRFFLVLGKGGGAGFTIRGRLKKKINRWQLFRRGDKKEREGQG